MARASYHHGDLRRGLVDAALKAVVKRGPTGLTLRGIARDAGVTHTAAYHHFRDKEDLLAAVAEEGYRELARRMQRALARSGPGAIERIDALARAYVRFAAERPVHFQVMAEPQMHTTGIERGDLREAHDAVLGQLVETVAQGQRDGEIVGADPEHFALALWTLVNGYAESHRTGRGIFAGRPGTRLTKPLLDQTLRPLLALMLRGASSA